MDEQAGLWLGGTLQRRSWLRVNSPSKDKRGCYFISVINLLFHGIMMNMFNAVNVFVLLPLYD